MTGRLGGKCQEDPATLGTSRKGFQTEGPCKGSVVDWSV